PPLPGTTGPGAEAGDPGERARGAALERAPQAARRAPGLRPRPHRREAARAEEAPPAGAAVDLGGHGHRAGGPRGRRRPALQPAPDGRQDGGARRLPRDRVGAADDGQPGQAHLGAPGRAAPDEGDPRDARPEEDPESRKSDGMKIEQNNDAPSFEKISACVHCGLCLEACPTYRELRVEMDSPRGRIYLMKGILTERIEPTKEVITHLDQCLDCRACETACPSGVEYGSILEKTRTLLEPGRSHNPIVRILRWFLFRKLLPNRKVQEVVFRILWIQQILGFTWIGRFLGRKGWLPGKMGAMAAQAPHVP